MDVGKELPLNSTYIFHYQTCNYHAATFNPKYIRYQVHFGLINSATFCDVFVSLSSFQLSENRYLVLKLPLTTMEKSTVYTCNLCSTLNAILYAAGLVFEFH